MIVEIEVPTVTPRELLKKWVKSPVRYLSIAAEGFDDPILSMFPFEDDPSFRPQTVVFEYTLLGEMRIATATSRLEKLGYKHCYRGFQNIVLQFE